MGLGKAGINISPIFAPVGSSILLRHLDSPPMLPFPRLHPLSMTSPVTIISLLCVLPGLAAAQSNSSFLSDDFSNNLFTDLVPLLSLFGEEVSKQFMSQSMGWSDDIIFAMCPLGILTAMICAIRAGGDAWLKAVIGRARETKGSVEVELLSSTSPDVCEVYGEEGLARVTGSASVEQWLFDQPEDNEKEPDIYDLKTAVQAGIFRKIREYEPEGHAGAGTPRLHHELSVDSKSTRFSRRDPKFATRHPPNILLNFHSAIRSRLELHLFAVFGVGLQAMVLIFGGLVTYYWQWTKGGSTVAGYAFPLTAAGTGALCLGLILCARVVEACTSEEVYRRIRKEHEAEAASSLRIVWLQKSQIVNDNEFDSIAIFGSKKQQESKHGLHILRTSHRNQESQRITVLVGVTLALTGYLCQLVGLRELHSSVALVQFGCTIVMTIVRSWVRRGLSERPEIQSEKSGVCKGHEQDWLALYICDCDDWSVQSAFKTKRRLVESKGARRWVRTSGTVNLGQRVLNIRRKMAFISNWELPVDQYAQAITKVLEATLGILTAPDNKASLSFDKEAKLYSFEIPILHEADSEISLVKMTLKRERVESSDRRKRWRCDYHQVRAILSLWIHSFEELDEDEGEPDDEKDDDPLIFCIGKATPSSYLLCYKWICELPSNWITIETEQIEDDLDIRSVNADWFPPLQSKLHFEPHYCVGSPEVDLSEEIETTPQKADESKYIAYRYSTKDPLPKIFAHHLFSVFMQSVAKNLQFDPLQSQTDLRRNPAKPGTTVKNKLINKITTAFVDHGMGTFEEGHMCIIPALAAERKLPIRLKKSGENVVRPSCGALELVKRNPNNAPLLAGMLEMAENTDDALLLHAILAAEKETPGAISALELAASRADLDMVNRILNAQDELKYPAPPELKPEQEQMSADVFPDKNNSLRLAAEKGYVNIVESLVRLKDINISSTDSAGDTALHLAARKGHLNIVRLLLEHGAILSLRSNSGDTPLSLAAWKGHVEVVQYILKDYGDATVPIADNHGLTPLNTAAIYGHETVVRLLVEHGADITTSDVDGDTPLSSAVRNGHSEVAKFLLEKGANVNTVDKNGDSPLLLAAWDGFDDIVKMLLDHKASTKTVNESGAAPIHVAARYGHDNTVNLLIQRDPSVVNTRDKNGSTALMWAARNGYDKVVGVLVKVQGLDMVAKTVREGWNALHLAAHEGHEKIVKLLLDYSKNTMNTVDVNGATALHLASWDPGYEEIVKSLLSAGANVGILDNRGETALHYAAICGFDKIADQLLAKGANASLKNKDGKTPGDLAKENGWNELEKKLQDQVLYNSRAFKDTTRVSVEKLY